MGRLEQRITKLEARVGDTQDPARRRAFDEFLRSLTDEELRWLLEPGRQAARLVPCPHLESIECQCVSAERDGRGFRAHPEFAEEYVRRRQSLLEAKGVVMR